MTLTLAISDDDARAYWKSGMVPNRVLNVVARALDRERPATLPVQVSARLAAPTLQPALFGALE